MIKVAIVGFGNIGKAVYEAVSARDDMETAAIISGQDLDLPVPAYKSIEYLTKKQETKNHKNIQEDGITGITGIIKTPVDVAILCLPSRMVPETAQTLLSKGINTVDSYDIHSGISQLRKSLHDIAVESESVAIIGAGWDPGTDSIMRSLLLAMVPQGETFTNFGPGMSMGHSVAARKIKGVKDAVSITVPLGRSVHRRDVYIVLEKDADFAEVRKRIESDDYFAHDETIVREVENIEEYKNTRHGVKIVREGISGTTPGQMVQFNMNVDNPALTGQILVSAALAATRQKPGGYTLIQIPPIDFLPGDMDELISKLV